ncbi:MAG: hypothetical protein PHC50_08705 [Candidatus Cloacimonetes bacterium]|nr:hypothetical protein [Candidatus Cloacimonadota bacterium]
MKKVLFVLLLVGLLIAMAACGGNKAKGQSIKPEGDPIYYPKWWNTQPSDEYICSYGIGIKLSETTSITAARAQAFLEAAQYVESEVAGMVKNFEEEAGVYDPQLLALTSSVSRNVAEAKITGAIAGDYETRRISEHGGQRYKTWYQLKIPKQEVKKNLLFNIQNEEALYNQFKASQAFMELDKELGRQ